MITPSNFSCLLSILLIVGVIKPEVRTSEMDLQAKITRTHDILLEQCKQTTPDEKMTCEHLSHLLTFFMNQAAIEKRNVDQWEPLIDAVLTQHLEAQVNALEARIEQLAIKTKNLASRI